MSPSEYLSTPRESVVWLDSSTKRRGWPSPTGILTKVPKFGFRSENNQRDSTTVPPPSTMATESLPRTPPTPHSPTSPFSVRHLGVLSPFSWIDLASDVESRRGSVRSERPVSSIASKVTEPEVLEAATGYETAARGTPPYAVRYHHQSDARSIRSNASEKSEGQGHSHETKEIDPEEEPVYPTGLRFVLICISMGLSTLPPALDRTIVATAIPQITNDFNSLTDAAWYNAIYLLFATAFQPTFGKVFQVFDIKGSYIFSMAIFMLGSLISGVSPNSVTFIVGRALAGLGSGGAFSGGLTIIAYTVPLQKRPAFTGMLGALFGIAMFVGPVLGGAFTDSRLTWRWCFYINLPITGLAIVGTALFIQSPNVLQSNKTFFEKFKDLDYIGPMIFLPANIMLLMVLQFGGSKYAWVSTGTFCLLFSFLILMGLWVYSQYKLGERATVPFTVMFQRTVFFASWFGFFSCAVLTVLATYAPYYFQAIYGSSALKSGVQTLPLIITATVFSVIAGFLVTVIGYYTPIMIVGMALVTIASGLLTTLHADTPFRFAFGFLFLAGVGMGMNLQTPIIAVQAVVDLRQIPVATALVLFFTQLGGGIVVAIAQSVIVNHLFAAMQIIDPRITIPEIVAAGATGLKDLTSPDQLPAVLVAYAKSIDLGAFLVCTVMGAFAFLLAFGVEWRSVKKKQDKVGNEDLEKDKDADAEE